MLRQFWETEMLTERGIIFNLVSDDIEHVLANLEVGFEYRDEVLAIIWVRPHTILQANKSEANQCSADVISHTLATLGNIEDEESPPAVPTPRFLYCKRALLHERGKALPFLCESEI